jgi:hypothetical protein
MKRGAKTPLLRLLLGAIFLAWPGAGRANEIWFAPRFQKMLPYDGGTRPIDYTALFQPGAPWPVTAAHVAVFKINAHYVKVAGDPALTELFQFLDARKIKVAMEFGMLSPALKPHVEGFFDEPATAQFTIDRIKAHGGHLDFIAMDEPCWFGSIYDKAGAVHWTAARIAANAAQTMRLFIAAFPGIQLGDIEPVKDVPGVNLGQRYAEWIDAMERAWGRPLAFFHADIVWNLPWRHAFAEVVPAIAAKHLSLGIIYNQSFGDLSNDHWLAAAREHFEDMENNHGLVPDQAVFQSWSAMPDRLLPETYANTHTGLVYLYLRGRVNFTAQPNGAALAGVLSDAGGNPIAHAPVRLEVQHAAATTAAGDEPAADDITADVAHEAPWVELGQGATDEAGKIVMTLPASAATDRFRFEFAGDPAHRAARTAPTPMVYKPAEKE